MLHEGTPARVDTCFKISSFRKFLRDFVRVGLNFGPHRQTTFPYTVHGLFYGSKRIPIPEAGQSQSWNKQLQSSAQHFESWVPVEILYCLLVLTTPHDLDPEDTLGSHVCSPIRRQELIVTCQQMGIKNEYFSYTPLFLSEYILSVSKFWWDKPDKVR